MSKGKTKTEEQSNAVLRSIEKSGMRFTQEQWDAQNREMEEDAKKPISQRRFLPVGLGTIAMDEHFFNEDLEKALTYSNAKLFVQLRSRSCSISTRDIPGFDPVAYLQDVVQRVQQYMNGRETKNAFQRHLFNNTANVIVKEIIALSNQYASSIQIDKVFDKKSTVVNSYNHFGELFYNEEEESKCVNALRLFNKDKPVISDTGQWENRKGSKAVLSAWIKRMENTNKIRFISDKKLLVPLLKDYFPKLDLGADGRTLKDPDRNLVGAFSALILP